MFPNTYNTVRANFTRPADTTAYASGDLVANSTTAGSVVPLRILNAASGGGWPAVIKRVRLYSSNATITNGSFRVHLFAGAAPTVSSGDNAAIVIATGALNYIGQIDVTLAQSFTDGGMGATAADISFHGSDVWVLLEARGAYTPTSAGVFTVALEVAQQ